MIAPGDIIYCSLTHRLTFMFDDQRLGYDADKWDKWDGKDVFNSGMVIAVVSNHSADPTRADWFTAYVYEFKRRRWGWVDVKHVSTEVPA
jgi:hypothetical protein